MASSTSDSSHEKELECDDIIIDITEVREHAQWRPECCIYKVPKRLRNVKKEAYTPKLISIGPVHHQEMEHKDMESLKNIYFKEFFSRTWKGQKDFARIVKENEDKIRHCYAPDIILPDRNIFLKMILLDSIFIIELFLRATEQCENDYILSKPWLKEGIKQDLILLENQLPFLILDELYQQIARPTGIHNTFLKLACEYFFPPHRELSIKKVNHFTDLHRYFYHPPCHKEKGHIDHIYSATKLDMAGLIFHKWTTEEIQRTTEEIQLTDKRNLLDVKIKKPLEICQYINCSSLMQCLPRSDKFSCLKRLKTRLFVPRFEVDDTTEDHFRNLMALEQCHYPNEAYLCNYILLLDFLIESKEDVEFLVDKGIIVNLLGSNEIVANMVNKLCDEICVPESNYCMLAKDLKSYYENTWNRNMATLKTVYFRDIWRGTATVVGVLVLFITVFNFVRSFV
nr:upf0481 protein [Quercus suber]